jgi:hypothetical protein
LEDGPAKKVPKMPSQPKKAGCGGMHLCASCGEKGKIGGSRFRPTWARSKTLSQKPEQKGWRYGSSGKAKHEILSSNPHTTKIYISMYVHTVTSP